MNALLLIIIGFPILEILVMIKVGQQVGAINTILLILLTAVVGIYYARIEGLNTIRSGFVNLYKNKIIHFKSDSLFNFLNENWHDLDKWWLSKQTQSAINVFIKNSAIKHKNPSSKLLKIIKKILK